MDVEGIGRGRDFKLYPGGGRAWDWTETGTRHVPGIQPSDVQELLDHGAKVVVLSRGMLRALRTCEETCVLLDELAVPYDILETSEAVRRYNALRETEPVGGLFHSTC
jgi:hypothetical protein